MLWIVYGLGAALIGLTFLARVRSARWWIRFADFPRLQLAVALAIVAALFVGLLERPTTLDAVFAAALAAALAQNLVRILPYTRLAKREVIDAPPGTDGPTLRIVIANVRMENRRADDVLALVRAHHPDVLLTLETDAWWDQRLRALDGDYPHAVRQPQDNHYGLHLFSRLELEDVTVRFLIDDDIPSVRARLRLRSGDLITFHGLHPRPPLPQHGSEQRDAELLVVAHEVKADRTPTIVAGDLNDVAWSHTTRLFQRISGLLDPRRGRGFFATFHADYPLVRWPLDHVFHDDGFTLVGLRVLGSVGSDHLPVLVDLRHQPAAKLVHEPARADAEDHADARTLIARGIEAQS